MHRMKIRNKAKECGTEGSVEPPHEQDVEEMLVGSMEDAEV